jgi:phage FluMu protein Com
MYILLKCRECGELNDIYCDGDSPMFCPDCHSIDSFDEPEEEEEEKAG